MLLTVLAMGGIEVIGIGVVFVFMQLVAEPSRIESSPFLSSIYSDLGFTETTTFLMAAGGATLIFTLIRNGFAVTEIWVRLQFQNTLQHSLSVRLLRAYMSRNLLFFHQHNSASLAKNILQEVARLGGGFIMEVINIAGNAIVSLIIFTFLVVNAPLLTPLAFGLLGGCYVLIYMAIRRRVGELGRQRLQANDGRFRTVNEALGGIKEAKLLGNEDYFVDQFSAVNRHFYRTHLVAQFLKQIPRYALEVVAFGCLIAFIVLTLAAGDGLAHIIGTLTLFGLAIYRLFPRLDGLLKSLLSLRFDEAAVRTIIDGLRVDPEELTPPATDVMALPFAKEIWLDNVRFRYPGSSRDTISDMSLSIRPNQTAGFVGRTGAGKSTLMDIVTGLIDVTGGRVVIDGEPLKGANLRRWQLNIGYVPQTIYLTDDSVLRNIAFGVADEDIDREAVTRAAGMACVHDFITVELPDGYDTIVGEGGVRLSGGERQRIGIARALYRQPQLLVLDEATSALDTVTEAMISETIQALRGNITVIVIAHRLSTVRSCDVIYMMDEGRIVGSGSYDELARSNTAFRQMVEAAG